MKNLLALAAFGVLLFLAVGHFRGWYQISNSPTTTGHNKVVIDFNGQKVKQDLDTGKEKLKKILDKDGKTTAKPQANSSTSSSSSTLPDLPAISLDNTSFEVPPSGPTYNLPPLHPTNTPRPHVQNGSYVLPASTNPPVNSTNPAVPPGYPQYGQGF